MARSTNEELRAGNLEPMQDGARILFEVGADDLHFMIAGNVSPVLLWGLSRFLEHQADQMHFAIMSQQQGQGIVPVTAPLSALKGHLDKGGRQRSGN